MFTDRLRKNIHFHTNSVGFSTKSFDFHKNNIDFFVVKDSILIKRPNQILVKACISIRMLIKKDLLLHNKGLRLNKKS